MITPTQSFAQTDSVTVNKYQLAKLIIENQENKAELVAYIKALDLKGKELREVVKNVSELKELSKKETSQAINKANRLMIRVKALNIVVAVETSIIGVGIGTAVLIGQVKK